MDCPLATPEQANPNALPHDHKDHYCWFGCEHHLSGACMTPRAIELWNTEQAEAHERDRARWGGAQGVTHAP